MEVETLENYGMLNMRKFLLTAALVSSGVCLCGAATVDIVPAPLHCICTDDRMEVGDRLLYHMYVDNIYHSDVTVEIVSAGDGVYELSLAGGDTMTVTEDRLLSGEWMTDGFEFRGNAYLETDNGYRYMDVYTGEFEEGKVTVFVGSDSVPYFVNCTLSDGTKYILDFADASWVY